MTLQDYIDEHGVMHFRASELLSREVIWSELDPGETSDIWRTSLGDGVTRLSSAPSVQSRIAVTNGIVVIQSHHATAAPWRTRHAAYRLTSALEGG
jgi:hypothetical protein